MTKFALALAMIAATTIPASAIPDPTKIRSGTPTYDPDLNGQVGQVTNIVSLSAGGSSCFFQWLTPVAKKIFAVCPPPTGFGESRRYARDRLCVIKGKIDKDGFITKVTKVSYVKEPVPGRDLCTIIGSDFYPDPYFWHLEKIFTYKHERWAQIEGWGEPGDIHTVKLNTLNHCGSWRPHLRGSD
jgi:hypothetical protein